MRIITFVAALLLASPVPGVAAEGKIENGKKVSLAYKLFVNGTLLESSDGKNPFTYLHGQNQIVPGLEKNLMGLHVGDRKTVRVAPEEAYGPVNPKAFEEIAKTKLPSGLKPQKGALMEARNPQGMSMLVKIVEVKEKTVVVDFNHPLAGKELEFQIEVLGIN